MIDVASAQERSQIQGSIGCGPQHLNDALPLRIIDNGFAIAQDERCPLVRAAATYVMFGEHDEGGVLFAA